MTGGKRSSGVWLFLVIPALMIGLIYWQFRSVQALPITELDQGLIETYCRHIAEQRHAEAYAECLSEGYRRQVPLEKFAEAHERARTERGVLQSRELLRHHASRNLFSGVRTFQFLYRLDYNNGERRDYIIVDDRDGEWRIEGTYTKRIKTLDFVVW